MQAVAAAPRPPTGLRGGPQSNTATMSTAEVLRRRLTQAESHLREMEEEANRIAAQQSRELETVENEHKSYLKRLELLRMEESMTPAELQALSADLRMSSSALATGPRGAQAAREARDGRGREAAARAATVSSKLIASTSVKYREARDMAQKKRAECAEVEANLAATRSHQAELRARRQSTQRATQGSVYAASVRRSELQQWQSQSREQLRGLEVHVTMEQERLSAMVTRAKTIREEIDTLLIAQSRYEKRYRQREDMLYEMMKQMSFLMEVCSLHFEERRQKQADLVELRRLAKDENDKYEAALEELDGVLAENRRTMVESDEKIGALRRKLRDAQKERHEVERANAAAEKEIQNRKERMRQRVTSTSGLLSDAASSATGRPHSEPRPRRLNDVDGAAEAGSEHEFADDMRDPGLEQIHQFDLFYTRLAELAGSDRPDAVASYTERSAEERFGFFAELNYLQDDIAKLEGERCRLLSLPAPVEGGAPEVAAADVPLAAPTAAEGGASETDDAREAARRLQERRAQEVAGLQTALDRMKLAVVEQGEQREALDHTFEAVVEHVGQMFTGLGCDPAAVGAAAPGTRAVMRHNVADCLAVIDQRTEEYLLAAARAAEAARAWEQQQQLGDSTEGGDGAARGAVAAPSVSMPAAGARYAIARTFLRRPDLPPRVDGGGGDGGIAGQLVRSTRGGLPRSVETHPSASKASMEASVGARGSMPRSGLGVNATGDEDVPLSMKDMLAIVRERHGGSASAPPDTDSRAIM